MLGHIPNSMAYRRVDQYSMAQSVPGVLILHIDAPIYFANAGYLRERLEYKQTFRQINSNTPLTSTHIYLSI